MNSYTACGQRFLVWRSYDGSALRKETVKALEPGPVGGIFGGARWRGELSRSAGGASTRYRLCLEVESGESEVGAVGLQWLAQGWGRDPYVLLPGALYGGNRFAARKEGYSPRYPEADVDRHPELLVTDIPRLGRGGAAGRVQMLTGDLSIPAAGVWTAHGRGWLVMQTSAPADQLWEIVEAEGQSEARVSLMQPGVRQNRYAFGGEIRADAPSSDMGRVFRTGDRVVMEWAETVLSGGSPQCLFDALFERSIEAEGWTRDRSEEVEIPVFAAAERVRQKMDRDSFSEELGHYLTDPNPASPHPFQTGWCGGGILEAALMGWPDAEVAARAAGALDQIVIGGQLPNGLFFGKRSRHGDWMEDFVRDAARPYTHRWTLVRRQGDILHQLLAAEARLGEADVERRARWRKAISKLADALVRLWEKEGQLGQFIDIREASVVLGGSASGALVPAGLARAAQRFGVPAWRDAAVAIAELYYRDFTQKGLSTGGPADAMQAVDSESCAALVESYLALYETTGRSHWLLRAEEQARQFASWVMPYDYQYPEGSEFARLKMPSTGSVFANIQNKHAAPGICTLSGSFLLKLFEHTLDPRYLDLLRMIVRFIPWTVSREDRPIFAQGGKPLPDGWINERVNTSDWDNNPGGVFYGSCWCEVSLLLTATEVPSVVVLPDRDYVWVLDHLTASYDVESRVLTLENSTTFATRATVRVISGKAAHVAPDTGDLLRVAVPPGEKMSVMISGEA